MSDGGEPSAEEAARSSLEEELRTRARQQAAVVDLGQLALAGAALSALAGEAAALVAATLDVEYTNVLELLTDGETMLLRAGVGWKDGLVGQATVGADLESQAGYTLASAGPVISEDLAEETRFSGPPLLVDHGVVSGMTVLIRGEELPYGVLGAHTTMHRTFSADDIHFLQAMANVLAEAFKGRRVEEELRRVSAEERRLRQRLEAYSRLVVNAQEAERRRIARELHDEVGQALTGLKLTLENHRRSEPREPRERLQKAQELVGELLAKIHDLSLDLRPAMLDDLGLLPALLWLLERYATRTHVTVHLHHSELDRRFPPETETAAYRIIQEALTNVARHAGVVDADVRCLVHGETMHIEVSDEGAGFDAAELQRGWTSGLTGMEERARAVGGELDVESEPGLGTRVLADLPVAGRSA
jgi:signal transduction histidine kinase